MVAVAMVAVADAGDVDDSQRCIAKASSNIVFN